MPGSFLERSYWHVHAKARLPEGFSSLEQALQLDGEVIESNPAGKVIRYESNGEGFYIKQLSRGGRGIRRYIARSRIRSEAKNQLYLESIGIPVAPVVAWGETHRGTRLLNGAFVSREVVNSCDLRKLANSHPGLFRYGPWLDSVSRQVAAIARKMHDHRFCHKDFKWRNILIIDSKPEPGVCMIDCPSGQFWFEPFLGRYINKDLACLDKNALRFGMTRTRRLAFFMQYAGIKHLSPSHKRQVRQILNYFN